MAGPGGGGGAGPGGKILSRRYHLSSERTPYTKSRQQGRQGFIGRVTDTVKSIVPGWLQKYFNKSETTNNTVQRKIETKEHTVATDNDVDHNDVDDDKGSPTADETSEPMISSSEDIAVSINKNAPQLWSPKVDRSQTSSDNISKKTKLNLSAFGALSPSSTPASSSSVFGTASKASNLASSSNVFGNTAPSNTPANSSSVFGGSAPSSNPANSTSVFGSAAPRSTAPPSSNVVFGIAAPARTSANSSNVFENTAPTNTSANFSSICGNSAVAANPPAATFLFSQPSSTTSGSVVGNPYESKSTFAFSGQESKPDTSSSNTSPNATSIFWGVKPASANPAAPSFNFGATNTSNVTGMGRSLNSIT